MTQDGLRVTGWHTQVFEQRPDRVTQVMNLLIRILLPSHMRRKDRTRFRGSIGRPVRVVSTRPRSGQALPISAR